MRRVLSLAVLVALLAPAVAHAQWPNGPDEDPRLAPPNDPGFKSAWDLWSYVPEEWTQTPGFRTEEIAWGTGMHADRAWQRQTGDRRVVIAVLDSGVYWDNKDLVAKYYLNRGELGGEGCKPVPLDTPPAGADDFDVDGSGWFDIRDYLARYWPADTAGKTGAQVHDAADAAFRAANPGADANGNGMLDPQDLLIRCSEGTDSDGNGYVDDISGWDFFADDNDAYDDNRFGHGNGEAMWSAAEGNNGIGDIGVCPGCTVLMVRAGDSFVADSNDFAHGVVFAVDSGATVIQEALGAINNTAFSREAIEYAYMNDVPVSASAADELSFHHNFPGTNNHTLYVHAIQYDGVSVDKSTTFLNFSNCTNYGMNLLLSTPGTGCSSQATAFTAGEAGLLQSAALELGLDPPLSAEEVKQLLVAGADDINVNPLDDDPTKFPSDEGWDWHFGYGRNNARSSLDALYAGHIPPEVDVVEPLWFQVLYPDRTPTLDLTGRINRRVDGQPARYDEVDYVVEYALGVAPRDGTFTTIASGTTEGIDGVLATWDLTKVPLDLDAAFEDEHQTAVTLRVRATGKAADGTSVTGEMRKGFLLARDPDLHDGFPRYLGSSGEGSPTFADLDGDGAEEIVIPLTDGWVHAYKADGSEPAGWPVPLRVRRSLNPDYALQSRGACSFREDKTGCVAQRGVLSPDRREAMISPAAVGDLDGDGDLEVVVSTWDGWAYAFEHDGTTRPGWPRPIDWTKAQPDRDFVVESGFFAAPVLYDMDGQPGLEIVQAAMDQHLYVWHADGSPMAPYPVKLSVDPESGSRIIATPAVGDIDGDGKPEIALGTSEVFGGNEAIAYVLEGETGEIADGWPQSLYGLTVEVLPIVGKGVVTNAILADLDYDGKLEVSFDTLTTQGWFFRYDGSIWKKMDNITFGPGSDSTDSPGYILMNNGAIGNIDGEGGLDFVKGTAGFDFAIAFAGGGERKPFDHHLSGWDTDSGKMMEGFPRVMDDWQFFNTPTIVDIDNDADPEVLIGSGGYLVHAFNWKGEEPAGWPKQTGGWIIASVNVGDLDGDGNFDVVVSTRDGWLYAWKTPGKAGKSIFEWNGFGHDPHNTNNYEMPVTPYQTWSGQTTPPDAGPEPTPDAGPTPDTGGGDDVGPADDTGPAADTTEADGATGGGGGGGGGGCAGGPDAGTPWAGLLALAGLAVLRRRRARA